MFLVVAKGLIGCLGGCYGVARVFLVVAKVLQPYRNHTEHRTIFTRGKLRIPEDTKVAMRGKSGKLGILDDTISTKQNSFYTKHEKTS